MLLHISMKYATTSSNDNFCMQAKWNVVLLRAAARSTLDLKEYQTSAFQKRRCLEPAQNHLTIVLNMIGF